MMSVNNNDATNETVQDWHHRSFPCQLWPTDPVTRRSSRRVTAAISG